MLASFGVATALHRRRRTLNHCLEVTVTGFNCFKALFGWERALGSLSCAFVVHGRLLSLQRPKTNRLPKPANQAPLRGCQRFCLWTGYHLASRAIPRKRGLRIQSPAESPICRPWFARENCCRPWFAREKHVET